MTVLVTGASGFIGSHLVARLSAKGRQVRVLARDRERVNRALAPHGAPVVEVVDGDVRDPHAVAAAVKGCDAVVHAANVYSLDVRRREEMHATNVEGTEFVLDTALDAGCEPVVHVSSVAALLPSEEPITHDAPIGTNEETAYIGSKVRAERVARERQQAGAPVVTTYPGAVFGPLDPGPGEMLPLLGGMLGPTHLLRLGGAPAFTIADVRWVAEAHANLLDAASGPRRVPMGGRSVTVDEAYRVLRSVTGRRLPALLPSPRWMNLASARAADALRRRLRLRLPMSYEQTWLLYAWPPTQDEEAERLAGPPPPVEQTLTDALRWMVEAGYLPAKRAGALTHEPVTV